jgi:hypothetical protein
VVLARAGQLQALQRQLAALQRQEVRRHHQLGAFAADAGAGRLDDAPLAGRAFRQHDLTIGDQRRGQADGERIARLGLAGADLLDDLDGHLLPGGHGVPGRRAFGDIALGARRTGHGGRQGHQAPSDQLLARSGHRGRSSAPFLNGT